MAQLHALQLEIGSPAVLAACPRLPWPGASLAKLVANGSRSLISRLIAGRCFALQPMLALSHGQAGPGIHGGGRVVTRWRYGVRKLHGTEDHARYKEWFKRCLADSSGRCPKRRRLQEGYALQKAEAINSGMRFKLDLARLITHTGEDVADFEPTAAMADAALPKHGLRRRHTV